MATIMYQRSARRSAFGMSLSKAPLPPLNPTPAISISLGNVSSISWMGSTIPSTDSKRLADGADVPQGYQDHSGGDRFANRRGDSYRPSKEPIRRR